MKGDFKLFYLLHKDPAGEGDRVPNGGDHQAVVLRRVLKPGRKLFQKSENLFEKVKTYFKRRKLISKGENLFQKVKTYFKRRKLFQKVKTYLKR